MIATTKEGNQPSKTAGFCQQTLAELSKSVPKTDLYRALMERFPQLAK